MVRETAAACIAVRRDPPEVCLVSAGEGQWSLPMALVGKGEVPKQTALRALREATGLEAGLADVEGGFYRTVEHVYRKGIEKVRREVHVYKVRAPSTPSGGTWVPAGEAAARVTSKTMRELVEAALEP